MSDEPKKKKSKKDEVKPNPVAEKFKEFRGEFRKIVWPSRDDLIKHTITVIVISLIFGALIALMDGVFGMTFTTLVGMLA